MMPATHQIIYLPCLSCFECSHQHQSMLSMWSSGQNTERLLVPWSKHWVMIGADGCSDNNLNKAGIAECTDNIIFYLLRCWEVTLVTSWILPVWLILLSHTGWPHRLFWVFHLSVCGQAPGHPACEDFILEHFHEKLCFSIKVFLFNRVPTYCR